MRIAISQGSCCAHAPVQKVCSRFVLARCQIENLLSYAAGTLRPIPTEPLCIPDLCLAGRLPQQHNAVFNLDLSAANAVPGAAADVTAWPEFHNGVAAGKLQFRAA